MYRDTVILLVDDDKDDKFLLKHALDKAGVNCRVGDVCDGEEAVRYLASGGGFSDRSKFPFPKMMVLDLKMPGMDGFEVLDWLRGKRGLQRLPVVVLTSSEIPEDVNRAHELDANGYLLKPTDVDGIEVLVRGLESFWLKCHQFPDSSW